MPIATVPLGGAVHDASNEATTRWCYSTAFSRNLGLISRQQQANLRRTRVAVTGLGSVGGCQAGVRIVLKWLPSAKVVPTPGRSKERVGGRVRTRRVDCRPTFARCSSAFLTPGRHHRQHYLWQSLLPQASQSTLSLRSSLANRSQTRPTGADSIQLIVIGAPSETSMRLTLIGASGALIGGLSPHESFEARVVHQFLEPVGRGLICLMPLPLAKVVHELSGDDSPVGYPVAHVSQFACDLAHSFVERWLRGRKYALRARNATTRLWQA